MYNRHFWQNLMCWKCNVARILVVIAIWFMRVSVIFRLKWNHMGRFPFNFKFLEISRDEWKSIFWNFLKRGQPCEVNQNFWKFLTRNYCSIWLSSLSFRNFWLNGSRFGNLTISGVLEIPTPFVPCQKFWNFWLNGNCLG